MTVRGRQIGPAWGPLRRLRVSRNGAIRLCSAGRGHCQADSSFAARSHFDFRFFNVGVIVNGPGGLLALCLIADGFGWINEGCCVSLVACIGQIMVYT